MKKNKDWAVLPYTSTKIKDKYLVSNLLGSWSLLDGAEFSSLEQFKVKDDSPLNNRLIEEGIIVNEDNFSRSVSDFRNLNSHLFSDTGLHIAVVTTRCNFSCRYCQTNTDTPEDMGFDVASKVLENLFGVRNPNINLEFQGGEPLLNWKIVKFFVDYARKFNTTGKNLSISLVTNGLLLDERKAGYLINKDVGICISMDGPDYVHDKNRILKDGRGTHRQVIGAIKNLKSAYKSRKINRPVDLLLTVTKYSLAYPEAIIDEYIKLGVGQIAIRPVNRIGYAAEDWENLGYSPEEFNQFWARAIDHILKLNKSGVKIIERLSSVMLTKIFKKQNPGYVDLMSPCGAGRASLVYMPGGDVYPCDEARMVSTDMFKLGNVLKDKYEDLMKSTNMFSLCQASLVNLWDYNNAYAPWMGTCPVLNYILGNNLVPKICTTPLYKNYHFQFDYLFKKMIEDKKNEEIFRQWAK